MILREWIRLSKVGDLCAAARAGGGGCRGNNGVRVLLKRQLNIDKGCKSLDWSAMLGMVEEVPVAAQELRIPLENIELRLPGSSIHSRGTAIMCKRWLLMLLGRTGVLIECHPANSEESGYLSARGIRNVHLKRRRRWVNRFD